MKIVVIGGAGFIGTELVGQLLSRGHHVSIVDKAPSARYPDLTTLGDVRDVDSLTDRISGCDVVVNLAAEHRDDVRPRSLYDEVNVDGARSLCAAMERVGVTRLVFTSSVAVYGFAPPGTDEEGALEPFNDYGRTKLEAERVYEAWYADHDQATLAIVRPTVVFGPGNRGNVYNLLRQIASGRFVMVGNGENTKSMAYVENVAGFLAFCCELEPGRYLANYVDKPDYSMNRLVAEVRSQMGLRPSRLRLPRWAGIVGGSILDSLSNITGRRFPVSAVRVRKFTATTAFVADRVHDLGYRPVVPIDQGLRRTLEFELGDRPI